VCWSRSAHNTQSTRAIQCHRPAHALRTGECCADTIANAMHYEYEA
jgi:hypothetical protein